MGISMGGASITINNSNAWADGLEATPGAAFALDPDTGFYRPAANQIGASVAATAQWIVGDGTFAFQKATTISIASGVLTINAHALGGDLNAAGNDLDNVATITDNSAAPGSGAWLNIGHGTTTLIGFNQAGASNRELISWGVEANDTLRICGDGDALMLGTSATFKNSVASASVADRVSVGGVDLSVGNRSLAIGTEHAVAVSVATASTHKVGVSWNGATYYILLSNV